MRSFLNSTINFNKNYCVLMMAYLHRDINISARQEAVILIERIIQEAESEKRIICSFQYEPSENFLSGKIIVQEHDIPSDRLKRQFINQFFDITEETRITQSWKISMKKYKKISRRIEKDQNVFQKILEKGALENLSLTEFREILGRRRDGFPIGYDAVIWAENLLREFNYIITPTHLQDGRGFWGFLPSMRLFQQEDTTLLEAARKGKCNTIRRCIQQGMNINMFCYPLLFRAERGYKRVYRNCTPLKLAVLKAKNDHVSHRFAILLCLYLGASINFTIKENGRSETILDLVSRKREHYEGRTGVKVQRRYRLYKEIFNFLKSVGAKRYLEIKSESTQEKQLTHEERESCLTSSYQQGLNIGSETSPGSRELVDLARPKSHL